MLIEKIKIKIPYLSVRIGHQARDGHHIHNNKPKRLRTRSAANKAAIREHD